MQMLQYFQSLARYNRWMNERLYAVCAEITDEERRRDRGAFFRSIHGTLNHLLLGDLVWLARFEGGVYDITGLEQEIHADFSELSRERARTDDRIDALAAGLTEERLAAPLRFRTVSRPAHYECPFWYALQHLFNHQTHHRGQLTTLVSQTGRDPGVTDLLYTDGGLLRPVA